MRLPTQPTGRHDERYVAWLCDVDPAADCGEDGGPSWYVSLTVCRVLDDEREEEHVEDVTAVVDGGGGWHYAIADHVLDDHRRWVRTARWTFDRRYQQWRASVRPA